MRLTRRFLPPCSVSSAELPTSIATFSKLESLNLFNNQLTELPPQVNQLSKLRALIVSCNKIKELPRGFGSCPALVFLDLSANEIETLTPNFFYLSTPGRAHTSSRWGRLMGNRQCSRGGFAATLKILHLADNKISVLPPEIKQLTALETVRWTRRQPRN